MFSQEVALGNMVEGADCLSSQALAAVAEQAAAGKR
jgi:hypothetical protein